MDGRGIRLSVCHIDPCTAKAGDRIAAVDR